MRRPQKFEKTIHLDLTLLSNFKESGRFFQTFLPSQNIWTLQKKETVWFGLRLLISFSPWKEQGRKEKKLVSLAKNSGSSIKYVSNFSYISYDLSHICTFLYLSLLTKQLISSVKFRYCEQAKRFEKISHFFLKLLSSVKWKVFSKKLWPSHNIWTSETLSYTSICNLIR